MHVARQNLEAEAIARFREAAEARGYTCVTGQGRCNRMGVTGDHTDFQFGDLRVETPERILVVEAESAGGVTNLVKYWYCLSTNPPAKPIALFHIFRQSSLNDYASHLALWDFLADKTHESVGDRVRAVRFTYRNLDELETAVDEFSALL